MSETRRLAIDIELPECDPGICYWCYGTYGDDGAAVWICENPDHPDHSDDNPEPVIEYGPGERFPKDCPLPLSIEPAPEELETMDRWFEAIFELVEEQTADEGLWADAKYASEEYVKQALLKIHHKVEEARRHLAGR